MSAVNTNRTVCFDEFNRIEKDVIEKFEKTV
jgi:hypothetical protein